MIDLHCHLMPGVDDGPDVLQESIDMLSVAAEEKIKAICVTPHFSEKAVTAYDNAFSELEKIAAEKSIILFKGFEYKYSDLPGLDSFVPLGKSSYVLVDFYSPVIDLSILENQVFQLGLKGFKMLVAHPERLFSLRHCDMLTQLASRGVYFQLNAASFVGANGRAVQVMAEHMLKNGLCHAIASDAHNLKTRGGLMKLCKEHIRNKYGSSIMLMLMYENPRLILDNQVPDDIFIPKRSLLTRMRKLISF